MYLYIYKIWMEHSNVFLFVFSYYLFIFIYQSLLIFVYAGFM